VRPLRLNPMYFDIIYPPTRSAAGTLPLLAPA
jgi:hypothetical protein